LVQNLCDLKGFFDFDKDSKKLNKNKFCIKRFEAKK